VAFTAVVHTTGFVRADFADLMRRVPADANVLVSSVLELPDPPLDDSGRDTETVDAGNPKLYATQNYFKQVQSLLDDLGMKKNEATNFGHMAGWIEQYAKRIDRLPTTNVDEDMQKYSLGLVELLRDAAQRFKQVGISAGGRQSQVWNSGGSGGYDYYGNRTGARYAATADALAQRRAIRGQEQAAGAQAGTEFRRQIQDETANIRKLMTERYKVNF
jgi:hypothetical protein